MKKTNKLFTLQFLISIAFTVIAIIGIIFVGGALYIPFYSSTLTMVSNDHKQVLEQVNYNLDTYLRSMMKISDSVFFKIVKNNDFAKNNIYDQLSLLYETNTDRLISIAIFTDEGEVVDSTPLSILKPNVNVTKQGWFEVAKNKTENPHFSKPHVQNIFKDSDVRYRWVISLSRYIDINYRGITKYGVLLVDMNFSAIEQICRKVSLGESGYVYITDQEGEIIYHPNQQLIYSNLEYENIDNAITYEDGTHIEDFNNQKRFVTVKTVGYTGWKIIGVSYIDEVTPYRSITFFAAIIIVLAITLMTFLNRYVSKRIVQPIELLEESVKYIDKGQLNVVIEPQGSSEVRHLAYAINNMLKQIKNLMDEVMIEQEQKLKSELDALQSQINPHFLYNVLDSIVWMIEKGNNKQAVVMVTAVSRLFRIGISRGDNIITIENEIEHAKNYLTIQSIRFKNTFTYEVTIQEEVKNMQTIKLIIQPIIENAIYHGVEFMDGEGFIQIKAFLKTNNDITNTIIKISDNGIGISPEKIDFLLQKPSVSEKGSGIGLYNVQKRIQLYYGKDYGIKIFSEPDEGTLITITLPAIPINS